MNRKTLKCIIAVCAVFAFAVTAGADEYTVNMCGASAQAGFWQKAGAEVIKQALDCDSAQLDGLGDKQLIIRGVNCDADGTKDDTVYVRYQAVNSAHGAANYDCVTTDPWPVPSSCLFTGGYTCTADESAQCQLGCSDVEPGSLKATTVGYEDGRAGCPANGGSDVFMPHGNPSGYPLPPGVNVYRGVVVPFGFIANSAITNWVCDNTDLLENALLAYDKDDWQCDPADSTPEGYNPWCRSAYKCIDHWKKVDDVWVEGSNGVGVCMDGNQTADLDKYMEKDANGEIVYPECFDASDCNIPLEDTQCEQETLKNLSRLMALHIFSDVVYNWNDFGPSFPSLAIVKCMRHGGSGTHQTLINTVFRGDATVKNMTVWNISDADPLRAFGGTGAPDGKSYVWHYKSSSDLTRDCVAYYAGGVGYVDADKVMFRSKIDVTKAPENFLPSYGIHQLMYQGFEPSRLAVANGEYNFWAAQYCFNDPTGTCYDPAGVEADILDSIMITAQDPTFLDEVRFGQRAYFWATQGEMKVDKLTEYAYPTR